MPRPQNAKWARAKRSIDGQNNTFTRAKIGYSYSYFSSSLARARRVHATDKTSMQDSILALSSSFQSRDNLCYTMIGLIPGTQERIYTRSNHHHQQPQQPTTRESTRFLLHPRFRDLGQGCCCGSPNNTNRNTTPLYQDRSILSMLLVRCGSCAGNAGDSLSVRIVVVSVVGCCCCCCCCCDTR